MWSTVAMWGGVAGLFISIFAIIILYLTRKNILDILDKDVILFGRNFEIKKKTITDAFQIIDEIAETNGRVKNNPNFVERAKMCYNDLLCVISDIRVADEFYSLALEDVDFSLTRIAQFKIMCRKDIGLKTKNAKAVKRVMQNSEKVNVSNETRSNFSNQQPNIIKPEIKENKVATNVENLNSQAQPNIAQNETSQSNAPSKVSPSVAPNVTMVQRRVAPTNTSTQQTTAPSAPSNGNSTQSATALRRPGRPPIRSNAIPANTQIRRPYPIDEGNE